MTKAKLQTVRGTKDLFGEEMARFNEVVEAARYNALSYGFKELQTPIFEFSEIFERNLGDESDIVAKEVYKFKDRGDNFLTLRPEFTASVVRAFLANGELQQVLPQKFFSFGPVFRYDRPQKGRQRQFNQVNFEVLGEGSYLADVEMILLAVRFLADLDILPKCRLEVNSLGCPATKGRYEEALREYFSGFVDDLSEDSRRRLAKNPLRILDSKAHNDIEICKNAPQISQFYSVEAAERLAQILMKLNDFGVDFALNPRLVRGLDYYTDFVFEFVFEADSAQNTVLAGGRYDNLVEKMGGKACAAIGFAAGVERLMLLSDVVVEESQKIGVVYVDKGQEEWAFKIAQDLRQQGFATEFLCDSSFKKQMKRANQANLRFVLILGEEELAKNEIIIKDFENSEEKTVKIDEISEKLSWLL